MANSQTLGTEYSCGSPTCAVGCDCDRYVEFWNLVFTQFNSDGKGNYSPLEHPNIDTGMGLERIACIMQGVENLFEVDTVAKIMGRICEIAGVQYKENEKKDVSLRVITDHIRSTVMLVGDGVLPSNEGRGYVLRRLLRRAARHGRLLGVDGPFLYKAAETVIDENKTAYPQRISQEKNLDLVKIAPQATPPVCRIMDYGKYRFEQAKREKEAKKNQKVIEIKEVRLSLNIDTNDLNTKIGHAIRFLKDGDKVKVSIRFRGREMAHSQLGIGVMERFAQAIAEYGVVEKPPKLEGRNMLMFIAAKPAK